MAGQAVSSVMQLSTFTKVASIPSDKNYTNFPVTVRVKAPQMTVHQHAPVDVVAVIDVSESMKTDDRLGVVKQAMAKVIENLAAGDQNHLAVVAFTHEIQASTELLPINDGELSKIISSLRPDGGTNYDIAIKRAFKILGNREAAAEKNRLAFIIFLSDGFDQSDLVTRTMPTTYPIHTFGISADHYGPRLNAMAKQTGGSYTPITEDLEKITEKLDQLSDKLTSIIAEDMHINLKAIHPGVSLSKIESASTKDDAAAGDSSHDSSPIGTDKRSDEITVGTISSGEEREFTVYLDVPEGQGNGVDGSMELLLVGGVYNQSWDKKQVALADSVVTVARPSTEPKDSCKELDWLEDRLVYWCKVKQDLSALYDKAEVEAAKGKDGAENKCQCQDTKALREQSLEAINRAMYHDTYVAALHALELRQCRGGGEAAAAAENSAA